jgi:hypothetical protein
VADALTAASAKCQWRLREHSIAVDFPPVGNDEDRPEIIECEIRLHSGQPANKAAAQLSWADWSESIVGHAVTFQAIANIGKGAWNGPLSPGVQIAAAVALDDPYWKVFLPSRRGVPIMVGQVGRPLAIGETFNLPPGQPGVWTEGVVFDGAIVIE